MKKSLTLVSLLIILGASFAATAVAQPAGSLVKKVPNPVPNSYLVMFRDGTIPNVPQVANTLANSLGGDVTHVYTNAIKGFSIDIPEVAAEALARNPLIASVEQDGVAQATAVQTNPTWGLDRIDQRDLPVSGSYIYNSTGAGVRAYVLDTGIRITHQDFSGRASIGYDAINDGQNGNDCNGHGTHVAGTIGSTTYGVAKAASLVAVRVLNCSGSGSWSQIIAGIDWVTGNAVKPAVANMSLTGGGSSTVDTAIRNSINSGIPYVVAAGNNTGADACNYSPPRVLEAITVGATQSNDARASFSNRGTCVDIFAPGASVLSTSNASDTGTTTYSGTSMASPHTAGVAALYLEDQPLATPEVLRRALFTLTSRGVVTGAQTVNNHLVFTNF